MAECPSDPRRCSCMPVETVWLYQAKENPYDHAIAADSLLTEGKPHPAAPEERTGNPRLLLRPITHESMMPMRHSQHTDSEILHLLYEADAGISIAEICSTAHISPRTFYRWRKRYGSLTPPALLQMKELQTENRRLRGLVDLLSERSHEAGANVRPSTRRGPHRPDYGCGIQCSAAKASDQTRGASLGRFASVRGTR
jgi:putative transposase